jgi:hypothetical protein
MLILIMDKILHVSQNKMAKTISHIYHFLQRRSNSNQSNAPIFFKFGMAAIIKKNDMTVLHYITQSYWFWFSLIIFMDHHIRA